MQQQGDVPKVGYFRDIPVEFKIKSLCSNDLISNIASKSKEAVKKLKFLDSPLQHKNAYGCTFLIEGVPLSKDFVGNHFSDMQINSQFGRKLSARNIEPRVIFYQHFSAHGLGLVFNIFS